MAPPIALVDFACPIAWCAIYACLANWRTTYNHLVPSLITLLSAIFVGLSTPLWFLRMRIFFWHSLLSVFLPVSEYIWDIAFWTFCLIGLLAAVTCLVWAWRMRQHALVPIWQALMNVRHMLGNWYRNLVFFLWNVFRPHPPQEQVEVPEQEALAEAAPAAVQDVEEPDHTPQLQAPAQPQSSHPTPPTSSQASRKASPKVASKASDEYVGALSSRLLIRVQRHVNTRRAASRVVPEEPEELNLPELDVPELDEPELNDPRESLQDEQPAPVIEAMVTESSAEIPSDIDPRKSLQDKQPAPVTEALVVEKSAEIPSPIDPRESLQDGQPTPVIEAMVVEGAAEIPIQKGREVVQTQPSFLCEQVSGPPQDFPASSPLDQSTQALQPAVVDTPVAEIDASSFGESASQTQATTSQAGSQGGSQSVAQNLSDDSGNAMDEGQDPELTRELFGDESDLNIEPNNEEVATDTQDTEMEDPQSSPQAVTQQAPQSVGQDASHLIFAPTNPGRVEEMPDWKAQPEPSVQPVNPTPLQETVAGLDVEMADQQAAPEPLVQPVNTTPLPEAVAGTEVEMTDQQAGPERPVQPVTATPPQKAVAGTELDRTGENTHPPQQARQPKLRFAIQPEEKIPAGWAVSIGEQNLRERAQKRAEQRAQQHAQEQAQLLAQEQARERFRQRFPERFRNAAQPPVQPPLPPPSVKESKRKAPLDLDTTSDIVCRGCGKSEIYSQMRNRCKKCCARELSNVPGLMVEASPPTVEQQIQVLPGPGKGAKHARLAIPTIEPSSYQDTMEVDVKVLGGTDDDCGFDGKGKTISEYFVDFVDTERHALKLLPSAVNRPLCYLERNEAQTLIKKWLSKSSNELFWLFSTVKGTFRGPDFARYKLQIIICQLEQIIEFGIQDGRWRGDRIDDTWVKPFRGQTKDYHRECFDLEGRISRWLHYNTDSQVPAIDAIAADAIAKIKALIATIEKANRPTAPPVVLKRLVVPTRPNQSPFTPKPTTPGATTTQQPQTGVRGGLRLPTFGYRGKSAASSSQHGVGGYQPLTGPATQKAQPNAMASTPKLGQPGPSNNGPDSSETLARRLPTAPQKPVQKADIGPVPMVSKQEKEALQQDLDLEWDLDPHGIPAELEDDSRRMEIQLRKKQLGRMGRNDPKSALVERYIEQLRDQLRRGEPKRRDGGD